MESNNRYIPNIFNVYEPNPYKDGTVIVWNNETREHHILPVDKVGLEPFGGKADAEWRKTLIEKRLLIRENEVENIVDKSLRDLMFGYSEGATRAVFVPGYDCQLQCDYCFTQEVSDCERGTSLSIETLAKRYLDFYTNTPSPAWELLLTGGETLLYAKNRIYPLSKAIKEVADSRGVEFHLIMVSNGELLTPDTVSMLMEVGFSKVAVSIDPNHDEVRKSKSGKGTFQTIMANAKLLPKPLKLFVGSVMEPGSEEIYEKFLREDLLPLKDRIDNLKLSIKCVPLKKKNPDKKIETTRLFNDPEIKLLLFAENLMDELGYKRETVDKVEITCEAFRACEAFILDAYGKQSFCPGLISVEKYQVDPTDEAVAQKYDLRYRNQPWRSHCVNDEGAYCPYLLNCWGGCRFASITLDGSWENLNCEFKLLDTMRRYYMRRHAKGK